LDDAMGSFKNAMGSMRISFGVFYGLIIGVGSLTLVAVVFIVVLKWRRFRIFLHIAWCFMSLFMVLGFLLSIVTVPLSVVYLELCDLLRITLRSSADMKA